MDFDAPFRQIGDYFNKTQGEMADVSKNAYHAGDVGAGMILQGGAVSTKFLWGVFEGATFIVRPWSWIPAVQGMWGLATDEKVREGTVSTFMADPIGGLAFGAGSFLGGYGTGKAIGRVTDLVLGKPGKASTLREFTGSVDDSGKATLKPTSVTSKKLPRGTVDLMDDAKPNKLMIFAEEETVTRGAKRLGGLGYETETRVPTGVKRAIIMDLDEAKITELTKTRSSIVDRILGRKERSVTVDKLTGSVQATPEDILRLGGDVADEPGKMGRLKGLTQFKETQVGPNEARPGALSYYRAGSTGLGMEDAWLGVKTSTQAPGAISPWDFLKPGGSFEGTTFSNFRAKVISGARSVTEKVATSADDWGPTRIPGKSTPGAIRQLSRPVEWPSVLTQRAEVAGVKNLLKSTRDTVKATGGGTAGASASGGSVLSTIKSVATQTGQVTIFSPVASSYGPAVSGATGLGLFNQARSRLDQTPGTTLRDLTDQDQATPQKVDQYLDTSRRPRHQEPEPLTIFEPDVEKPHPPRPIQWIPDPEPVKIKDPTPPEPTPEKTRTIVIPDIISEPKPEPPPPPPPPMIWTSQPTTYSPWTLGPGGGMWGGPRTAIKARSRKKVYDVAHPLSLIGARAPLNLKPKARKARRRSPLGMIL